MQRSGYDKADVIEETAREIDPGSFVPPEERLTAGSVAGPPARGFSIGATFLGWALASFFTLVFVGILRVVAGADVFDEALTSGTLTNVGIAGLVAYLVVAFAAYVIGGYVAGRLASTAGAVHGMFTVAWALVIALVALMLRTTAVGTITQEFGLALDAVRLSAVSVSASVLALLVMLAGGGVGGTLGERVQERLALGPRRLRRLGRTPGRPL